MTAMLNPQVVSVPLSFTDEDGNPLPAETLVALYPIDGPATPDAIVFSSYLGPTSSCNALLTIGESYRVRFVGNRAPTTIAFFTLKDASGGTIAANNYISPSLDTTGFANEVLDRLYPQGWLGTDIPNAIVTAKVIGSLFSALTVQLGSVAAAQRLHSTTDDTVEAWAQDFFGGSLPRYRNEPLDAYIGRIESEFDPQSATLAAIQIKARAFLVLQATYSQQQVFSLDTAGAIDTFGGLDESGTSAVIPKVTAFDRQSDPNRSTLVGLTPGQVCVLFTYAGATRSGFFEGFSKLGYSSFLLNANLRVVPPPSDALDKYLGGVKALGIQIIYADNLAA